MNKRDDQPQLDKFKQAARELETDDREEAFDAALKRIAVAPPKADPVPEPPKKPKG